MKYIPHYDCITGSSSPKAKRTALDRTYTANAEQKPRQPSHLSHGQRFFNTESITVLENIKWSKNLPKSLRDFCLALTFTKNIHLL